MGPYGYRILGSERVDHTLSPFRSSRLGLLTVESMISEIDILTCSTDPLSMRGCYRSTCLIIVLVCTPTCSVPESGGHGNLRQGARSRPRLHPDELTTLNTGVSAGFP